ncbi:hypothetical protein QYF36_005884 [Acer negundo]|nr:hypothetical protein QYF36_005884 [Acer negundo]
MKDRRYGNFLDLITDMAKQRGLEDLKVSMLCVGVYGIFASNPVAKVIEEDGNKKNLMWKAHDLGGGVVERILNGKYWEAKFGHFLQEIAFLRVQNLDMKFLVISKGANWAVQSLARIGLESLDNKYWMEEVPTCISDLVATCC